MFTEIAVKVISYISVGVFHYVFYKLIAGQAAWKPPFKIPVEIVWMLFIQFCIWLSVFICPIMIFMNSILLWVIFQAFYFFLKFFAQKPLSQSNKVNTSIVIISFLNVNLYLLIAFVSYVFVIDMNHYQWVEHPDRSCGPIGHQRSINAKLIEFMHQTEVTSFAYDYAVAFYPSIMIILYLLFYRINATSNFNGIRARFTEDKIKEYLKEMADIQKIINRKKVKVDIMEAQQKAEKQKKEEEKSSSSSDSQDD